MEKIADNVYVQTGVPGCNHGFVVTTQGLVMIDTPMVPSIAVDWRDTMAEFGPVRYLINTEPHVDHFAGNMFFDGTRVAHNGVRGAILSTSIQQYEESLKVMAPESSHPMQDFHFLPPTITYSKELTLYLGDHTFKLMHMPGHSPFQTAVYVPEEKVIFTSDNVTGSIPFLFQALPFDWLDSLKRLQSLDANVLVPGHGAVCSPDFIPEMSGRIQAWIDVVKQAIASGMSLDEAQDKVSLLEKYPMFAGNPRARSAERANVARLYEVLK